MASQGGPALAEVSELLDQCSSDELSEILKALETGGLAGLQSPNGPQAPAGHNPVPPARPPPAASSGRRPAPVTLKKLDGGAAAQGADAGISMADLKRVLEQHSASVVSEVQKMLPGADGGQTDILDLASLTKTLGDRDKEVRALEATLADLQQELAAKDKRVADLGGELDRTVREVRHKQLDLEFQQLKLEERVRCNAELEQNQRKLTARVEEASLNARHAALDVEMCLATPRTLRAQGTLPWTVRKNRLPSMGATTPR